MKKTLIGSLTVVILFFSCAKSNDSQYDSCDSNYDPCAIKAPDDEIAKVKAYLDTAANIADTVRHCSGLFYTIDNPGTGKEAGVCSNIYIKYKGMLADGTVFEDQSLNAVGLPLGRLISGFKNGIPLIKEGGTIHLYIPPTLAYGSKQMGTIPPNSILIFEVNLVTVQ